MAVESDLRARVAKLLREHGYMTQPIETGAIVEGVPDLWYSKVTQLGEVMSLGRVIRANRVTHSGWIELKKIKEMPKKSTTAIFKSMNHPLLQMQENWIENAIEHGTTVWILVGYGRDYFMIPGYYASQFNSFTELDLRKFQVDKSDIPNVLLAA